MGKLFIASCLKTKDLAIKSLVTQEQIKKNETIEIIRRLFISNCVSYFSSVFDLTFNATSVPSFE